MSSEFEQNLDKYAELAVKVGLNLQPGQRLCIGLTQVESAPLVRLIATHAYKRGARLVEVIWTDDQLRLIRFQHAPRDSFEEFPSWWSDAVVGAAKAGDAVLVIRGENPDLLAEQDPDLVATERRTWFKHFEPYAELLGKNKLNWTVIAAPVAGWAKKLFPNLPPEEQKAKLWNAIFDICRVKQADPMLAWEAHITNLLARCAYLNHKHYRALKMTAPGTDLTVGLPRGHIWKGGRRTSETGIPFTGNIPTEEIYTLPHRNKTEGVVSATKTLSYGGILIENFSLTFAGGRVVNVTADKGEAHLRNLIETDESAGRLGEVALVPHSSPISQSGLFYYDVLIDENAANHIALGRAYKHSMENGEAMDDDEFAAAGGNTSMIHTDFMIGSGEMNVDGFTEDGTAEPIMRSGEWTFEV